jgi:hypothetical protein
MDAIGSKRAEAAAGKLKLQTSLKHTYLQKIDVEITTAYAGTDNEPLLVRLSAARSCAVAVGAGLCALLYKACFALSEPGSMHQHPAFGLARVHFRALLAAWVGVYAWGVDAAAGASHALHASSRADLLSPNNIITVPATMLLLTVSMMINDSCALLACRHPARALPRGHCQALPFLETVLRDSHDSCLVEAIIRSLLPYCRRSLTSTP